MVSLNFHFHMACLVTMEHLAVMDVTDPKENGAGREGRGFGDQRVQTERRERRESLELRAPPAKKDSEGRGVRVELQNHLNFPRTWTGKNAPGKRKTTKAQVWSRQMPNLCLFLLQWNPHNGTVIWRASWPYSSDMITTLATGSYLRPSYRISFFSK